MTNEQRIRNVQSLGYTEQESKFLCKAALHGGYFVRRQYLSFADCDRGKRDTILAEKALRAGHVRELVFRHNRKVYSLCSRPLFEALGDENNRNRRLHEVSTIKSRLIGLDFVLSHPKLNYLPTEAEKVAFFKSQFGVEAEDLPAKRYRAKTSSDSTDRHFVDKFPIAVESGGQANQSRVLFCFVDEGAHSTSGFESYLEQYRRLFARVSAFRLMYVSTIQEHLDAAKRLFASRVQGRTGRPPIDPNVSRLLGYFADRDAYERKELARFDQRRLIQFREDRSQFAAGDFEALFESWKESGDAGVLRRLCPECMENGDGESDFTSWISAFRYELFGTLSNGNWRGS